LKLKPFSEDQIIERIRFDNPWWETGKIPDFYLKLQKRLYFDLFIEQLKQTEVKRAVVMMGPRRVGKTVTLFQSIQQLLDEKTSPSKICYLSLDTPIYNNISLDDLFRLCRKSLNEKETKGFYLFFDEIQYLKNWEVHLKSMVDSYHETKFVASGSSAAALRLKSEESGAGRFSDFLLPPLTFHEYLSLKGIHNIVEYKTIVSPESGEKIIPAAENHEELNKHFIDYINYGGYPEIVMNPVIQNDPGQYIRNDIIDKVLLRDLPSLYGIRDVQELNAMFNVIAYHSGNEFNLEELSKQSGVDKNTIRRYLEYLEAAFLIKIIYPVGINTKRFLRAARFKIYLTNPSMRCALFAPITINSEHLGQMVETAIFSQWMHWGKVPLHYSTWHNGEVDMVMVNPSQKPDWAIEIKWSNLYFDNPEKLKGLIKYAIENKMQTVYATSIDKFGYKTVKGKNILFYQAAAYCYAVGKSSLDVKRRNIRRKGDSTII
jgi:predicted AAA+ superfamily ATPase